VTLEAGPPSAAPRLALAAAAGILLAAATLHQLHDARGRAAVERFFTTFTLDARRPELLATARVEIAADLAMQVAVRATTLDVAGQTPLAQLAPSMREAWLRSVRELPEEAEAARELALEALAARPAWAFHSLALAGLVLADEWRQPEQERQPEKWLAPVRLAAAWAPGLPAPYTTWGAAALRRWPLLPEAQRRDARAVLRRALEDEGFRSRALGAVVRVLGTAEGLALLPDTPEAFAAARRELGEAATFEEAAALDARWRAAEREVRRREAAEIAASLETGRADRAVAAAYEFLRRHPLDLFDDVEGRQQARTVLGAIGDGRPGEWPTDPRASLVQWLLANPLRPGEGVDPAKAVRGLTHIPDGVQALLHLYAGDELAARNVERQTDTEGSSEWTPYWIERVRRELRAGAVPDAEMALARVSRFDLAGCDALLVRRDVARARQRGAEVAALDAERLAAFPLRGFSAWPDVGPGRVELCVDPEAGAHARLHLTVRTEGPALAWWGWDGGREDVVRIEGAGDTELSFALAGLHGLRTLALGPVAGARVRPTRAWIAVPGASSHPSE
jgi:hypothetical protein